MRFVYNERHRVLHIQIVNLLTVLCVSSSVGQLITGIQLLVTMTTFEDLIPGFSGNQLPKLIIALSLLSIIEGIICFVVMGFTMISEKRAIVSKFYLMEIVLLLSAIIIIVIFATIIMCIIKISSVEGQFKKGLQSSMEKYILYERAKSFVDEIQIKYQCCGSHGHESWHSIKWSKEDWMTNKSIPFSCCKTESIEPCRNYDLKSNITDIIFSKPVNPQGFNRMGCAKSISKHFNINVIAVSCSFIILQAIIEVIRSIMIRLISTSLHRSIEKGRPKATTLGYLIKQGSGYMMVESECDLSVAKREADLEKSAEDSKTGNERLQTFDNNANINQNQNREQRRPIKWSRDRSLYGLHDGDDGNKTSDNAAVGLNDACPVNKRSLVWQRRHKRPINVTSGLLTFLMSSSSRYASYPSGTDSNKRDFPQANNNNGDDAYAKYGSMDAVKRSESSTVISHRICAKGDADANLNPCNNYESENSNREVIPLRIGEGTEQSGEDPSVTGNSSAGDNKRRTRSRERKQPDDSDSDSSGFDLKTGSNADVQLEKYYYNMYCASISDTDTSGSSEVTGGIDVSTSDSDSDTDTDSEFDMLLDTDVSLGVDSYNFTDASLDEDLDASCIYSSDLDMDTFSDDYEAPATLADITSASDIDNYIDLDTNIYSDMDTVGMDTYNEKYIDCSKQKLETDYSLTEVSSN